MDRLVGCVEENEKDTMIDICEIKVALDNLQKIIDPKEIDIINQIEKERSAANDKYNEWWKEIGAKYNFEGDERGYWKLDFRTGEVFLVV